MKKRPAGVEPAHPPWQGSRLPLHHGRVVGSRLVKDHQSTGRDSNPRRRITGAVSWPLGHQCMFLCGFGKAECRFEWPFKSSSQRPSSAEVGLVGIEPTSSGLRDRCITLSATIPIQSARWESDPRPASYKDAALTTELRASASRAGGNRTHTCRIKSPVCCLLHYDPVLGRAYPFQSACVGHRSVPVVRSCSGSPESRTQRDLVISQVWTTGPRLPESSSREGGTRTHDLVFPKHAGLPLPYIPSVSQNGRDQSGLSADRCPNRRSRGPQPRAMPGFATFCLSTPWGSRTQSQPGFVVPVPYPPDEVCRARTLARSGPDGARTRVSWASTRRFTV